MSYCPYCGEVRNEQAEYCSHCGKKFDQDEYIPDRSGLVEHLKFATKLSFNNPKIFLPEFIWSILQIIILYVFGEVIRTMDFMTYFESIFGDTLGNVQHVQYDYPDIPPEAMGTILILGVAVLVGLFIYVGISGLFTFANVKMIKDSYDEGSASLTDSLSYVMGRLGWLFLAAMIANLLVFTFILIPAAFYLYAIMVVDEAGIRESLSKGFKLFLDNIMASIGIIILYFVCEWLTGYIPMVSDQVFVIPSSILMATIVDMYINQRGESLQS